MLTCRQRSRRHRQWRQPNRYFDGNGVENYGTDVKSENFTLLQHNDTLVSDAELLKSIAEDTSAKRLKKARIFKWTAWVGGSVFFLASLYCLLGTAYVASFQENGPGVNPFAIGLAASFGASVIWTTSFLIAAHHQKKLALSANVSMLNDNLANRRTLGVGLSFKFWITNGACMALRSVSLMIADAAVENYTKKQK